VLGLVLSWVLLGERASYVQFPPRMGSDLISHSVCELPPESEVGMYRVPIPETRYRLEYRKRWRFEVILLVSMEESADTCRDRIVGLLQLPTHGEHEAINFECAPRGRERSSSEFFIGIIPNGVSKATATPAWRIDLASKAFGLVHDVNVECTAERVD